MRPKPLETDEVKALIEARPRDAFHMDGAFLYGRAPGQLVPSRIGHVKEPGACVLLCNRGVDATAPEE